MKFERFQGFLKSRLFIYLFLFAYIIFSFVKQSGTIQRVPLVIYIVVMIFLLAASFIHITLRGYSIFLKDDGVYKRWSVFNFTILDKRIVQFERLFIALKENEIKFFDLEETGRVHAGYSFGEYDRACKHLYGSFSFIPIFGFRKFVREVLSRVKHAEIDEISKAFAIKVGVQIGDNIKVIARA